MRVLPYSVSPGAFNELKRILHAAKGSKQRILLVLIVSAFGLCACTISQPEMPQFETDIAIPLGENVFSLVDLVENSDILVASGDDSILTFSYENEFDPFDLSGKLDFRFRSHLISDTLGSFSIDPPDSQVYLFGLPDLYPPAADSVGSWAVIPPFYFHPRGRTHAFGEWETIELASGTLVVEIGNMLPIPLGGASSEEKVEVVLFDDSTGAEILRTGLAAEIPPGGTLADEVDLSGVVLPARVYVQLQGYSPGSGSTAVWVDPEARVRVTLRARDFRGAAGTVQIPAQFIEKTRGWALPESLRVEEAVIASGEFNLTLSSSLPVSAQVDVELLEFSTPQGAPPLTYSFTIDAASHLEDAINLSGAVIRSSGANMLDSLSIKVKVQTTPSAGAVPVSSSDGVSVAIAPADVHFARIKGSMKRRRKAIEAGIRSIDLPSELEGFSLAHAQVVLNMRHRIGMPSDVSLTVRAFKEGAAVESVIVHKWLPAAQKPGSLQTAVILDETNSNIINLINAFPDQIQVIGWIEFGGQGVTGSVDESDFIHLNLSLSSPLQAVIDSMSLNSEPDSLEIDQEMRDFMRDEMKAADFEGRVENRFPFSAQVFVRFARTPEQLDSLPGIVLGPVTLEAALTDSLTGQLIVPYAGTIELSLNEEQIEFLRGGDVFSDVLAEIPGTDGRAVTLLATHSLRVNSLITLHIMVK